MIETRTLSFTYPGGAALYFPDLNCRQQEKLLISGPSGSGKTTLLQLLSGLRAPTSGEVIIKGQPLTKMSPSQLDQFRGRNIGLIFQKMHFVEALNVEENILLQQFMAGATQNKSRVHHLLDRLGILQKKHKRIRQLSLGEQQRVSIARALVNSPAVLLADEPTSSLDDLNSQRVLGLLEQMAAQEKAALIVVTHDQRVKDLIPNQISL